MSWLISQALMNACANSPSLPEPVEEYLAASCSDGEPCAQSSGSLTQQAYLPPDKMTAFSRPSRFGMTFKPLTASLGGELLTWFLGDSRARTSPLQEKAQESTASAAVCGDTWRGSLARFDPDSRSWKTAQLSLLEDSGLSSVIWPRSGMTADGQCWELPMSGRRTRGTDFGLWVPTPCAMDARPITGGNLYTTQTGTVRHMRPDGKSSNRGLAASVAMWPTPTVCGNHNRKGASLSSGDGLATAVYKCATPTARDWKSGKASQATMERNSRPLSEQIGGSLNPTWVELLMGWPKGWTDLSLKVAKGTTQNVSRQACDREEIGRLSSWANANPWAAGWEDGTMRVANGVAAMVDRLRAIGNGQVPRAAAAAFTLLTKQVNLRPRTAEMDKFIQAVGKSEKYDFPNAAKAVDSKIKL